MHKSLNNSKEKNDSKVGVWIEMSHGGRKIKIAFLFFSTSNEKNFFPLASNSYSILKSEFIKKERDFLFFF